MAKFIKRLTEPSADNKNYLHYAKSKIGGYNYCIHIKDGSCLPNCVGYAWGRWREILGKKHNLSLNNAENWWGNTSDGYERGQTPKVGAVICWRKGQAGNSSDGAGHVGVVEQVNADGSIITSMSDYSGRRFYTRTFNPPYTLGSTYTFQGFIYLPIDFDEPENETSEKVTEVRASQYALNRDTSLSGTYTATDYLNIRDGAGTDHKKLVCIPKGYKVTNYGYFTYVKGVKWLYVTFNYNGVHYTGFACSTYLTK